MHKGIDGGATRGVAAVAACTLLVVATGVGGVHRSAEAGAGTQALAELLAGQAVEAIRLSAWHEGEVISPVVSPTIEVSDSDALEVLCAPPAARGALLVCSQQAR